jgi:protein-arginine kinase activator protein McsA
LFHAVSQWRGAADVRRQVMHAMLCENCHQREATCHLCQIEGDDMKSRDLYRECYEASSPQAKELLEARCEYCRAEASTGGTDLLDFERLKFLCEECSVEHERYVGQHMPQYTSSRSAEEQLSLFRKLNEQVDEHMKQWVSKRDSK